MNQGIKFYKTYDVKKISECHQSIGPKTLTPNSRLDRWSGVHNAISDWMINDADDEVSVKVVGFDRGKVKLSMKRVDQDTGEDIENNKD